MLNLLRLIFLLLLIAAVVSPLILSESHDKLAIGIIDLCQDSDLIILGEKHKKPDSQELLQAIVNEWVAENESVFIGLEISRDNQAELDAALSGGNLPEGTISSIIDHQAYRHMIKELGRLPVTVKAIDSSAEDGNRDQGMMGHMVPLIRADRYDKVIILVGNNHAIKSIKWHPETGHSRLGNQYLAGRLAQQGVNVCSVVQDFSLNTGKPRLLPTTSQEGSHAAMQVIKAVYHDEKMSGTDVADAVVVW